MIKKGSDVKILTGKDKNKTCEVIEVDVNNDRIKVKGLEFYASKKQFFLFGLQD